MGEVLAGNGSRELRGRRAAAAAAAADLAAASAAAAGGTAAAAGGMAAAAEGAAATGAAAVGPGAVAGADVEQGVMPEAATVEGKPLAGWESGVRVGRGMGWARVQTVKGLVRVGIRTVPGWAGAMTGKVRVEMVTEIERVEAVIGLVKVTASASAAAMVVRRCEALAPAIPKAATAAAVASDSIPRSTRSSNRRSPWSRSAAAWR
jgi:hypothetical protein